MESLQKCKLQWPQIEVDDLCLLNLINSQDCFLTLSKISQAVTSSAVKPYDDSKIPCIHRSVPCRNPKKERKVVANMVATIHVVKIKNRVMQLVLREMHWCRCKMQTQLKMQDTTQDARIFFNNFLKKKIKNKFCVINKHTTSFAIHHILCNS